MKSKKSLKSWHIFAVVLAVLVIAFFAYQSIVLNSRIAQLEDNGGRDSGGSADAETGVEDTPDAVIDRLAQEDFLEGQEPVSVDVLTDESLALLKEKYSAVYAGAKSGDYDVKYPGWWVIYSNEDDEIVAKFRIQSINIPD